MYPSQPNSSRNYATPNITYGYSRDHRPDLKQFILDLICSSDGDVPLFLKVASGNESDQKVFAQIAVDFKKQIDLDTLMVADSALYSAANLALMKQLKWLCRVPLTVAYAKQLVSQLDSEEFIESGIEGYSHIVKTSSYGGVKQRWLIVESEATYAADIRQLEKRISKLATTAQKKLQKLTTKDFACRQDAVKAAETFAKQFKYHTLTQIKIINKPHKASNKSIDNSQNVTHDCYHIQADLEQIASVIESEIRCAGRFVIATNVLDEALLSNDDMISHLHCATIMLTGIWFSQRPLIFHSLVYF